MTTIKYEDYDPKLTRIETFEKKDYTDKETGKPSAYHQAHINYGDEEWTTIRGPECHFSRGINMDGDKASVGIRVPQSDAKGMTMVRKINETKDNLVPQIRGLASRNKTVTSLANADSPLIFPYPIRKAGEAKGRAKPDSDYMFYPKLFYMVDEKTGQFLKDKSTVIAYPNGKHLDWDDLIATDSFAVDFWGIPTIKIRHVYTNNKLISIIINISNITVTRPPTPAKKFDDQDDIKKELQASNPGLSDEIEKALAALRIARGQAPPAETKAEGKGSDTKAEGKLPAGEAADALNMDDDAPPAAAPAKRPTRAVVRSRPGAGADPKAEGAKAEAKTEAAKAEAKADSPRAAAADDLGEGALAALTGSVGARTVTRRGRG